MTSRKISPDDLSRYARPGSEKRETWRELAKRSFSIPVEETELYDQPFDAFEDVLALFTNGTYFSVKPDSPCLTTYLVDWKPNKDWVRVHFEISNNRDGTGLRIMNGPIVEFSNVGWHYCILQNYHIKTYRIMNAAERERLENMSLEERNKYLGITVKKDERKKSPKKMSVVSAYQFAQQKYAFSMEPQVCFSIGFTSRAVKTILTLRESCLITNMPFRLADTINSNGELMVWYNEGQLEGISVDRYSTFLKCLRTDGCMKVFQEFVDWEIRCEPIDRFTPNPGIEMPMHAAQWRDGKYWLPGAHVRLPYLASMMCDMVIGFGPKNVFPAYVLLWIFDFLPESIHWTHWQKISMSMKIHKSMQRLLVRREQRDGEMMKIMKVGDW
jgi:hypothetical protein